MRSIVFLLGVWAIRIAARIGHVDGLTEGNMNLALVVLIVTMIMDVVEWFHNMRKEYL